MLASVVEAHPPTPADPVIVHVKFPVGARALVAPYTLAVIVSDPPSEGLVGVAASPIVGVAVETTGDVADTVEVTGK